MLPNLNLDKIPKITASSTVKQSKTLVSPDIKEAFDRDLLKGLPYKLIKENVDAINSTTLIIGFCRLVMLSQESHKDQFYFLCCSLYILFQNVQLIRFVDNTTIILKTSIKSGKKELSFCINRRFIHKDDQAK